MQANVTISSSPACHDRFDRLVLDLLVRQLEKFDEVRWDMASAEALEMTKHECRMSKNDETQRPNETPALARFVIRASGFIRHSSFVIFLMTAVSIRNVSMLFAGKKNGDSIRVLENIDAK